MPPSMTAMAHVDPLSAQGRDGADGAPIRIAGGGSGGGAGGGSGKGMTGATASLLELHYARRHELYHPPPTSMILSAALLLLDTPLRPADPSGGTGRADGAQRWGGWAAAPASAASASNSWSRVTAAATDPGGTATTTTTAAAGDCDPESVYLIPRTYLRRWVRWAYAQPVPPAEGYRVRLALRMACELHDLPRGTLPAAAAERAGEGDDGSDRGGIAGRHVRSMSLTSNVSLASSTLASLQIADGHPEGNAGGGGANSGPGGGGAGVVVGADRPPGPDRRRVPLGAGPSPPPPAVCRRRPRGRRERGRGQEEEVGEEAQAPGPRQSRRRRCSRLLGPEEEEPPPGSGHGPAP